MLFKLFCVSCGQRSATCADFVDFDDRSSAKTLGIRWNANTDSSYFNQIHTPSMKYYSKYDGYLKKKMACASNYPRKNIFYVYIYTYIYIHYLNLRGYGQKFIPLESIVGKEDIRNSFLTFQSFWRNIRKMFFISVYIFI